MDLTPPSLAVLPSVSRRPPLRFDQALYHEYNQCVFGSRLPTDLPIRFNGRLTATAGYCYVTIGTASNPAHPLL